MEVGVRDDDLQQVVFAADQLYVRPREAHFALAASRSSRLRVPQFFMGMQTKSKFLRCEGFPAG